MKDMEKASIKKILWKDIRKKVELVNGLVASIIDKIDPDFHLYLVRYPYGSIIVNEGTFNLPNSDGILVPINTSEINSKIRADFSYSSNGLPAGMILEHSMHESVTTSNQILPLGVVSPGSIFALWKRLDSSISFHPIKMFTITAGARFIFFLPNISDNTYHKNLKRDFNIRQPSPRTLVDQWEVFKAIANHPNSKCNWETELLLFPNQWIEKIKNDSTWQTLYLLMLEMVWKKSSYERNQMFYNLAFSRAKANRNLKPNPYLADTAKHLFMIAAETVPGFGVAINDNCAPIHCLQDIYVNSYGLKGYIPTILLPTHFSFKNKQVVYYSLTLPTTLEYSPKSRKISSTLHDLCELQHITNIYIDEIRKEKLKIEDTIIGKIANEIKFNYYHSRPDKHGEIKSTSEMTKEDPYLLHCPNEYGQRKFSDSGTFIRGCVRISGE